MAVCVLVDKVRFNLQILSSTCVEGLHVVVCCVCLLCRVLCMCLLCCVLICLCCVFVVLCVFFVLMFMSFV